MRRRAWLVPSLAAVLVGSVLLSGPTASASNGQQIDRIGTGKALVVGQSDDGDLALLETWNDGFTPDDTNREPDVFLADLASGAITRVSGAVGGRVGHLSADGSTATWFSEGQTYVTDIEAGTTAPLDVTSMVLTLSADGQVVLYRAADGPLDAFGSPSPGTLWTYDRRTGTASQVSTAIPTGQAFLSRDGSTVAFTSYDQASHETAAYRVRVGGGSELLRRTSGNVWVAGLSADGDVVAVSELGNTYVTTPDGVVRIYGAASSVSADGRKVAWGDNNAHVRDLATGEDVGLAPAGSLTLSGDGSTAAWTGNDDGKLYVADLASGRQRVVCCDAAEDGAGGAARPWLSFDGTRITFFDPTTTQGFGDPGLVYTWLDRGVYPTTTTSSTESPTTSTTELPTTTTSTTSTTTTTVPATTTTTVQPPPAPPVVSIADAKVAEDARQPMAWTISLDRPSSTPVTVRWWSFTDTSAPSDRRATADKDFKPTAGSVTFAPGETSKTATALVFDDSFLERDEWFSAAIIDATGATLGRAKAVGTINDDESARFWSVPRSFSLF